MSDTILLGTYIIAFNVRHAQRIRNVLGHRTLSTACRARDEPYVVMFRLVADVRGHGVVCHDHVCLFELPRRLGGRNNWTICGHVGWRDWRWSIDGYGGIVG